MHSLGEALINFPLQFRGKSPRVQLDDYRGLVFLGESAVFQGCFIQELQTPFLILLHPKAECQTGAQFTLGKQVATFGSLFQPGVSIIRV